LNRKNISYYYDQKISDAQSKPARLLNNIYEYVIDDKRRDLLMSILRHYVPGLSQNLEREIGYKLGRETSDSLQILDEFTKDEDNNVSAQITSLITFLNNFRDKKSTLDPLRLMEHITVESGIMAALIIDGKIVDKDALSEVSGLLRATSEFHHETGSTSHVDFLEYLGWWINSPENNNNITDDVIQTPVVLQTVHGSKGLEYPVVFVIGLSNRKFPAPNRSSSVDFPVELYKEILPTGDFRKQEERRLFYVAMTRAREKLYLYGIQRKGVKISQYAQELMKSNLFDLFGEKEEIEIELVTNLPKYGPAQSKEHPASFVMPVTKNENVLKEAMRKLWETLSLQAETEDDFKKLKLSFIESFKQSLSSITGMVNSDKYVEPSENKFNEINSLAYSDLESFGTCPLQFYYRKLLRLPSPVGAQLTFGNIIHTILENAGKKLAAGEKVTTEELYSELDKLWHGAAFDNPDSKERMIEKAKKQLDNFMTMQTGLTGKPIGVERRFTVDLGTIKLLGKIDRIDKTESGFEIIDYKTGNRNDKKLKDDLQLPIYSLACKSLYGEYPKRLMYMFLNDSEPFLVNFDDDEINSTIAEIKTRAEEIKSSDFTATPGFHCGYCGYAGICPARQK